jgi:pimeloyl-ACP methyl ester carboxylesterase
MWHRRYDIVLAAGCVAFSCTASGCHDLLFLRSTQHTIPVGAQRVEIEGVRPPLRGETIEGWYAEYGTDGRRPGIYVLAFSGTGGRAEYTVEHAGSLLVSWVTAPAARPGIGVLAMNYPGFGGSDGPATLGRLGAAALDAYDALVERADGAPIFIYGRSMGTTAALHVGASRSEPAPAGLILDRGPDLPGIILSRYGWWNLWTGALPLAASLPRVSRSVANARRNEHVPALFFLATQDKVVTPRNGYRVFAAYRGPKQLTWIDGEHSTLAKTPRLTTALQWLRNAAEQSR